MMNYDFYGEHLSENYIHTISLARKLLAVGRIDETLILLAELEASMQVTLAMGDCYGVEVIH